MGKATLAKINKQVVCLSIQKKRMSVTLPKEEQAPLMRVG